MKLARARIPFALLLTTLLLATPGAAAEKEKRTHSHDGHAQHSFADVERYAAMFEAPERDAWQRPDELIGSLGVKSGMNVADVGAGTGYFAVRFAKAVAPGGTVYATDIEPNMVTYLRDRAEREKLPNLVPVLCSKDDPRVPERSCDLIFICDTWHHVADRIDYARRLQSDLAPGGRVVVVDFLPGELPVGPPPETKMSADQVRQELEKAGYRLATSPPNLPYQYVLVFEVAPSTP